MIDILNSILLEWLNYYLYWILEIVIKYFYIGTITFGTIIVQLVFHGILFVRLSSPKTFNYNAGSSFNLIENINCRQTKHSKLIKRTSFVPNEFRNRYRQYRTMIPCQYYNHTWDNNRAIDFSRENFSVSCLLRIVAVHVKHSITMPEVPSARLKTLILGKPNARNWAVQV